MSGAFVQGDDRILLDGTTFLSGAFVIRQVPGGQKMLDIIAGGGSDGGPTNVNLIPAPDGFDAAKLFGDAVLSNLEVSGFSSFVSAEFTGSVDVGTLESSGGITVGASLRVGSPGINMASVSAFSAPFHNIPGGVPVSPNLNADLLDDLDASAFGTLANPNTWIDSQIFNSAASFQSATVPFVVVGTDQVDNLNSNYLQGFDATHFANADNLVTGTVDLARGGTNADNSSQAINLVFATPASGGAGAMSIRALVAADMPVQVPLLNAANVFSANNRFNALFSMGAAPVATVAAFVALDGVLTGTSQTGVNSDCRFSGATSLGRAITARVRTAAAASTMALGVGVQITDGVLGSGSAITTLIGMDIAAQTVGGTNIAIRTGNNLCQFGGDVSIAGALKHTGSTAGFYNATPAARPAAYTQTYATATRTHAARTTAALADSVAGTVGTTLAAVPDPADTPATADALRDDLVANVLPKIRNALSSLADQINKGRTDDQNTSQLANSILDDLQTLGLLQ